MTSNEWILVIGAISVGIINIIGAIFLGLATYKNSGKIDDAKKQAEETATLTKKTAETTEEKLNEIHDLTNSNLSKVTQHLKTALERIEVLEQTKKL